LHKNRLLDNSTQSRGSHFLHPGELIIYDSPHIVETVLGSCVSITVFDTFLRVGGICHALLARGLVNADSCKKINKARFKYVKCCIYFLTDFFLKNLGSERRHLEYKLFGGAALFSFNNKEQLPKSINIGRENIREAEELAQLLGFSYKARKTGGDRGYKLFFYTDTGEVLVREINRPGYREQNELLDENQKIENEIKNKLYLK